MVLFGSPAIERSLIVILGRSEESMGIYAAAKGVRSQQSGGIGKRGIGNWTGL
jgi:hypothetical protein